MKLLKQAALLVLLLAPLARAQSYAILMTSASGNPPFIPLAEASGLGQSILAAPTIIALCSNTGGPPYTVCTFSSGGGTGTVTHATGTPPIVVSASTTVPAVSCPTCTVTIASGQTAIPVTALAANTCDATATTATATGAATTDAPTVAYASDPTGVTGYGGGTNGGISIRFWTTANTFNFKRCNESSGSITPGALTLGWKVTR